MNYIKRHSFYYLSLFLILGLGILFFLRAQGNRGLQEVVLGSMILSYIFWAVLHHYLDHDLSFKIMIEYILIGVIGLSILLFAFRGLIIV